MLSGDLNMVNNTIADNTAGFRGGGISCNSGDHTITNSIFAYNSAPSTANIYEANTGGTISAKYSIFDTPLDPFVVDGGNNIVNADPYLFATGSNYGLYPCSPAKNVGLNSANNFSIDVTGSNRLVGTIDMGAFESSYLNSSVTSLFVDQSSDGNGSSWQSPLTNLQVALDINNTCGTDSIFVAEGIYYPDDGPGIIDNDTNARFIIDSTVVLERVLFFRRDRPKYSESTYHLVR